MTHYNMTLQRLIYTVGLSGTLNKGLLTLWVMLR
jgi:hypothetical protein